MIASPLHGHRYFRKRFSLVTFVVMLLAPVLLFAQIVAPDNDALTELDRVINDYLDEANIPGALVAVATRGEIIHLKTYGMANVELAVPVSENTVFEIGSISKQFVAAAVMLLVEEGKLGLDDGLRAGYRVVLQ